MKTDKTDFVLVYCSRYDAFVDCTEILLILKNRPDWMAGKFNLPGGGIEEGETPEDAAKRELFEETGLETYGDMVRMGTMKDRNFTIHCLKVNARTYEDLKPRAEETEKPEWMLISEALKDKRLLPNLRVIIPLCRTDMKDWHITDSSCPNYPPRHTLEVTVPTFIE